MTITLGFTSQEQVAVDAYEGPEATAIRDCFDVFDHDSIRGYEAEFGRLQCHAMLKEHAGLLNDWYDQIDRLLGDMLTCSAESSTYSPAAREFLAIQAGAYHKARWDFEYAVTAWTLDLDNSPFGNYPPATRWLNLPMQSLTTE